MRDDDDDHGDDDDDDDYGDDDDRLVDVVRSYGAGFIFTTSLPPTVLRGATEAVRVLRSEEGRELRRRHQDNVQYLRQSLLAVGVDVEHTPSHIIPVHVGDPALSTAISDKLIKQHGHYVQVSAEWWSFFYQSEPRDYFMQ